MTDILAFASRPMFGPGVGLASGDRQSQHLEADLTGIYVVEIKRKVFERASVAMKPTTVGIL